MENDHNLSSFPWAMLCFVDFSGEFKQMTPAFAKVLGRIPIDTPASEPQHHIETKNVWPNLFDLIHPEDRQVTELAISQLTSGCIEEISYEIRCQQTNGNYHWLLWKTTAVRNEHGFYAQITDISSYKKQVNNETATALTPIHQHLLLILDSLDALVYVADIETYEILYENQYGKRIFGDLVGKVCWKVFLQQKHPCPFCSKHQVLSKEGEPSALHKWECYSSLTNRWYAVHDRAIRWVDGRLVRLEIAYDITERKQTQQALELGQERYLLAVRAGKTGVWDWNLKTKEMYLGPHLKELLGMTEIEPSKPLEAWVSRIYPDDVERLRKVSRNYLRQRISHFEEEYRLLNKEGQIRWMIVRGTAMRDEKGRAYRMVGTNTDITERKYFDECLEEQQYLCQGVAQITHTLLTVSNYDQAIYSALKTLASLTSVDRAYIFENEVVPATGEIVINQRFCWVNDKYRFDDKIPQLKHISYTHYLPGWYNILKKDKPIAGLVKNFPEPNRSFLADYQVLSILIVPIHFKGKFWGFIGLDDCHREHQWSDYEISVLNVIGDSIRGAFAHKQFKESLRESEIKFRSIIENSRDAIFVCNEDGLIRFVNPAAEKLYQSPIAGLIGKYFCAPIDLVGKPAEFKFKDLKGLPHVGELQVSTIGWEGEQMCLAHLHDITDRKRAEVELQKNKESAESSNRFKSLFLATMSHEIRTPMNGVLGTAELLHETKLTHQQQHYVQMIENAGQALLTVINDILDFSRIEAGKGLNINTTIEFNPRKLLEEMVSLFAASAQSKGLEILCQLPPLMPEKLIGDPNRLRQILNNLLGNAIKFTNCGEVLLRLLIGNETTTKVVFYFEIIDTGIGIKKAARHELFQLYFQSNDSKLQHQGAGLGLYISHQLVYAMGGKIDLKSDYGKGSTFCFEIPFEKTTCTLSSNPAKNHVNLPHKSEKPIAFPSLDKVRLGETSTAAKALRGIKILIVDDNANSRQILLNETRAWQMEATAVSSSQSCLTRLREAVSTGNPYQFALIDAQMPKLEDGLNLLQKIQAEPGVEMLKVVMMTTLQQALAPDILEQLAGYLNKPIFQADLLTCLLSAIKVKKDEPDIGNPDDDDDTLTIRGQVLLAEDNVINQEVAKAILIQQHCNVHVVANGLEAVEAVKKQDFDLIFMDYHMPELNGYDATMQIRDIEKRKGKSRIPIIAFTADVMQSTRERCLLVGMDDVLTKPLVLSRLKSILNTWLKNQESSDSEGSEVQTVAVENAWLEKEKVLDPKALKEMRQNIKPKKVKWLISLYLEELPSYLKTLQETISSQNGEAVYLAAHKFKGASAILGVQQVVALCKELETSGHEKAFDKAKEQLAKIKVECARAKEALSVIGEL
jgi:PAS domain S-box-containing protein